MSLTKEQEAIADMIALRFRLISKGRQAPFSSAKIVEFLALDIGDVIADLNPDFKPHEFYARCGILTEDERGERE